MNDWIDLAALSGLRISQIDESLHPVLDGRTLPNSLYATTGCHLSSGGVFNTTSMAAVVGAKNKHYFQKLIDSQPEFAFIYRQGRFRATLANSLQAAWGAYEARVDQTRQRTADENLIRSVTLSARQ